MMLPITCRVVTIFMCTLSLPQGKKRLEDIGLINMDIFFSDPLLQGLLRGCVYISPCFCELLHSHLLTRPNGFCRLPTHFRSIVPQKPLLLLPSSTNAGLCQLCLRSVADLPASICCSCKCFAFGWPSSTKVGSVFLLHIFPGVLKRIQRKWEGLSEHSCLEGRPPFPTAVHPLTVHPLIL